MKIKNYKNYRLGFDIGGTFTDIVLYNTKKKEIHLHKCLTTPGDPSIGVINGIKELLKNLNLSLSKISHAIHGTTLITNAIIERKGCKLGYLTTLGFRDSLEMGTEQRYDIHDLFLSFPKPLVRRSWRREINERISRDGKIISAIDPKEVLKQVKNLVKEGVEAISICFLHSYKNPRHEKIAHNIIKKNFPNIHVSISSEVHPQIREYERASTTTANAYVQPLSSEYIINLSKSLKELGFSGHFHLIQSSGGLAAPKTCVDLPIRFLESGPAGGAQNTAYIGKHINKPDIISFDMGGTTAKTCLIQNSQPEVASFLEVGRVHRFKKGSGFPVYSPVIDLIEIGAGGGSIAKVNELGLLKIGPESAGADPGPACYGLGGTEATVTDALLLLGFLDPNFFLGGKMKLNKQASEKAIEKISKKLSLSPIDTAWGIYELVCENMAGSIRIHIVEKNSDPRSYAIAAMGGAGPLHAAHVAKKLGIKEIIVPPASGAASAFGFLTAPTSFEMSQSYPMNLNNLKINLIKSLLKKLESQCKKKLKDAGTNNEKINVEIYADMRLSGQMHEISVKLSEKDLLSKKIISLIKNKFEKEYIRLYTHLYRNASIQIMNWRVVCKGDSPKLSIQNKKTKEKINPLKNYRKVYFKEIGKYNDVPVYDRYKINENNIINGPAIIEEEESTTIIPPNINMTIDDQLNIRIKLGDINKKNNLLTTTDDLLNSIKKIESDPIGLEVMWSRMINITEECWQTVIKTAFSLVIGEAQDFGCEILDSKGNQIVHSPRAMPVFNLTLPIAVKAMIDSFPTQTLKKGDILATNDPWLCAGHAYDIAVAAPVFYNNRVVAFVGVVGHVSDIGGTLNHLKAQEIYEEGLQIPPTKLFVEGKPNQDIFNIIRENVRNPDQVLGDVHALVSACLTGSERIIEFMQEYGMNDLESFALVVQKRAEIAMRKAIKKLPDGIYKNTIKGDGIKETLNYPVKIVVKNDNIEVDYKGAPPQTKQGGSNCTFSYSAAHTAYALKCILTPEIPSNIGCYKPMSFKAPKGSIFNCDKPMAVNTRTRSGWYIAPNIFLALSKASPNNVIAYIGLPSMIEVYGFDKNNKSYHDQLFQGGGQGGSIHRDGKSGVLYPTSAANTSVEMFENRAPILVICKEFVIDSAGAGYKRGGLGQIVKIRKLYDDKIISKAGIYPNGIMSPTNGLFGGKPSLVAKAWFINRNNKKIDLGTGGIIDLISPKEVACLRLAGGSGYGNPRKRKIKDIKNDLKEEYVSLTKATKDYCYSK